MKFRKLFAVAVAVLGMATAAHAAPLTKIRFVTDWKAQAEHGGFYEALAEGLYKKAGLDVTIIEGGPAVNVPQMLAGGAADFGIGSNGFIALQPRQAERATIKARDGDLPEGPAGADHPSARRREEARRHEGHADHDLRRGDGGVVAVAAREIRLQRHADPQIHLQPRAVPRRSQGDPGRLSDQRALHDRDAGAFQAAGLPARRQWLSRLRQHGAGAAEMDRHQPEGGAGVRRRRRATAGCDYLNGDPRPGQRAYQARQSGDERRADQAGDRQDEGVTASCCRAMRRRSASAR